MLRYGHGKLTALARNRACIEVIFAQRNHRRSVGARLDRNDRGTTAGLADYFRFSDWPSARARYEHCDAMSSTDTVVCHAAPFPTRKRYGIPSEVGINWRPEGSSNRIRKRRIPGGGGL